MQKLILSKQEKIRRVRAEANEFAEQFIPQMYTDGDTRAVTKKVYDRLVEYGREILRVEGRPPWSTHFDSMFPEYHGPFGVIKFAVSDVEEA